MDGIEKELGERAKVVRVPGSGPLGKQLLGRAGIRRAPATLIFGAGGDLLYQHAGIPRRDRILGAITGPTRT